MFSILQITEDKKEIIYDFLAAILHLNNIEFGCMDPDDLNGKSYIIESTKHHVKTAANLLKQSADKLECLLLSHSVKILNSEIS